VINVWKIRLQKMGERKMTKKEIIKKIHDDCVQAIMQCPQCEVEIEDLPYPKSFLDLFNFWRRGIDYVPTKKSIYDDMYPRQVAWRVHQILDEFSYDKALNEYTIRFFENGEEAMEQALEIFCENYSWVEKEKK
jgi:hypothetical protein